MCLLGVMVHEPWWPLQKSQQWVWVFYESSLFKLRKIEPLQRSPPPNYYYNEVCCRFEQKIKQKEPDSIKTKLNFFAHQMDNFFFFELTFLSLSLSLSFFLLSLDFLSLSLSLWLDSDHFKFFYLPAVNSNFISSWHSMSTEIVALPWIEQILKNLVFFGQTYKGSTIVNYDTRVVI